MQDLDEEKCLRKAEKHLDVLDLYVYEASHACEQGCKRIAEA